MGCFYELLYAFLHTPVRLASEEWLEYYLFPLAVIYKRVFAPPNTLLGLSPAHDQVVQGAFIVSYTVIYWTLHLKHTRGLNLQKKTYN